MSPYRWVAHVPGGPDTVIVTPAAILVTNYDRPLLAFSPSCGTHRATCAPMWKSDHGVIGITVRNGRIYAAVTIDTGHVVRGGIATFPLHCRPVHKICEPLWFDTVGPISSNSTKQQWWLGTPDQFTTPTVRGGVVYSSGSVGRGLTHPGEIVGPLYAFDATCPSRSGCPPLWRTKPLHGVGAPTIRGGSVYVPSTSGLYAFAVGCASDGATCPPLWHGSTNINDNSSNFMDQPVVSGGRVMVTTEGDVGGGDAIRPSIFTYPMDCRTDGGLCPPSWWAPLRPWARETTRPQVHAAVALVTTPAGLAGYPVACLPEVGVCKDVHLLSDGHSNYSPYTAMSVIRGSVVAPTDKGRFGSLTGFDVFSLPCERAVCRPFAIWHAPSGVGRMAAVDTTDVYVSTRSGVAAVSIPTLGHQPHMEWRWTEPTLHRVSRVVPSGCTTYLVSRHLIYSVRRC